MSDSSWFDQSGDEWDDSEYPDVPEDDDETPTATCPECGAEVYEDTLRCPVCEAYITPAWGNTLWSGRPVWWIVLGFLGLLATIIALALL